MVFHQRLDSSRLSAATFIIGTILFAFYFSFYIRSLISLELSTFNGNPFILVVLISIRFIGLFFSCVLLIDFFAFLFNDTHSLFKRKRNIINLDYLDAYGYTLGSKSFYINIVWISFLLNECLHVNKLIHSSYEPTALKSDDFIFSFLIVFFFTFLFSFLSMIIRHGIGCWFAYHYCLPSSRIHIVIKNLKDMNSYCLKDSTWVFVTPIFFSVGVILNILLMSEYNELLLSISWIPFSDYVLSPLILTGIGFIFSYCLSILFWFDEDNAIGYIKEPNEMNASIEKPKVEKINEENMQTQDISSYKEVLNSSHNDVWDEVSILLDLESYIRDSCSHLSSEQHHTIQRMMNQELDVLVSSFVSLSNELQTLRKNDVVKALQTLQKELKGMTHTIDSSKQQTLDNILELIHTRYKK